ncbi:hypothetical protein ACYSNW_16225, partial [Enterococcus sp. LJL99]
MKKWNKFICLGLLATTIFYTTSPVVTFAINEGQSDETQSTGLSSSSDLQTTTSLFTEETESFSSSSDTETSSTEETKESSQEIDSSYPVADASAY